MIRIIEISPKPDDATSYYRSRGPLTRLEKEHKDIEVIALQGDGSFEFDIKWSDLIMGDILFLSRPASANILELVKLANKMNMPVWVDYDDLLLEIPKWNRAKTYYDQYHIIYIIEQILTMAQVVTVTTSMLEKRLSIYNDNVHIIPNAIDDYLFPEPIEYRDNNLVVWRGSASHMNDLYVHRESINKMMAEFPEYEFIFIGNDYPFLDSSKNKSVIPPMDIFSYFKFLRQTNASYNIIPLANNNFNIAKSNISWLETHWSGSMSIAPAFANEVYDESCQYLYGNPDSLFDAFSKLVKVDKNNRQENWERGVEAITDRYILSTTNRHRYELVKDLYEQFK